MDPNERLDILSALLPLHEAIRILPPIAMLIILLVSSFGVLGMVQCALFCGRH